MSLELDIPKFEQEFKEKSSKTNFDSDKELGYIIQELCTEGVIDTIRNEEDYGRWAAYGSKVLYLFTPYCKAEDLEKATHNLIEQATKIKEKNNDAKFIQYIQEWIHLWELNIETITA